MVFVMLPGYQQQTHHNLILPLNLMHPNLIFYGAASFSLKGCTGAARTAKLRHPFKSTQIEVAQLWGTTPPALFLLEDPVIAEQNAPGLVLTEGIPAMPGVRFA
jgi:hypothetical protein